MNAPTVEMIPMDRSYIELVSELARLAEAMGGLDDLPGGAMARLIEVLSAPRMIVREPEGTA